MSRFTAAASAVCLTLALGLFPCPSPLAQSAGLEADIDSYLGPIVNDSLISGSILIARGDSVLLTKGYGLANREYDMPCTPKSVFRLGSITKQFTAMAIMLLEERGLLSTDDLLGTYYPEFPGAERITLHQLLTHTSGIINSSNIADYGEKSMMPLPVDSVVAWIAEQPLAAEPGEQFIYSNSGYIILAGIVEQVTEQSYAEFLDENIFTPLGMTASGQDVFTDVIPNRATGHVNYGQGIWQAPYRDMPFMSGAGSLRSSVEDLYRWDRALANNELISAESKAKMFTPVQANYACGWFVFEQDGRRNISHGGAINGFLTNIDRYVDDTLTVICLFNYESTFARRAFRGIADIALGEQPLQLLAETPATIEQSILEEYAGSYLLMGADTLTVGCDGGGLYMVDPDAPEPLRCAAQSANLFWFRDMNAMIQFVPDEDGAIRAMSILSGAHHYLAERI